MDNPKYILKDKVAPITCKACGGDLRPVNELFMKDGLEAYNKFREGFKKETGLDWKESESYNCVVCGLIYDKEFINTGNTVAWLGDLQKYYNEK